METLIQQDGRPSSNENDSTESDVKMSLQNISEEEFKQNMKLEQQSSTTEISPELFDEIKTKDGKNHLYSSYEKGISIGDLNRKGLKVLLFFPSSIGCLYCKGTIHDIFQLENELLKLNCVPVIAHAEDYEAYEQFINSCDATKKFSHIYHLERKEITKYFKLEQFNLFSEVSAWLQNGISEMRRISQIGLKNESKYFKGGTGQMLAAVFVIYQGKVISEYRKEHKYQRFDLARILIDTDGQGIDIHTSIFECEIPKKKKPVEEIAEPEKKLIPTLSLSMLSTEEPDDEAFDGVKISLNRRRKKKKNVERIELDMTEVLKNKKYRKYFKVFATNEFSVENILFYEEVKMLNSLPDDKKPEIIEQIIKTFLQSDSIYEINTSERMISQMMKEKNDGMIDGLFDAILMDVMTSTLSDTFSRFIHSDLYDEMTHDKSVKKYLLFQ